MPNIVFVTIMFLGLLALGHCDPNATSAECDIKLVSAMHLHSLVPGGSKQTVASYYFAAESNHTVRWYDPFDRLIENSVRFRTFIVKREHKLSLAELEIRNGVAKDSGHYRIVITSSYCVRNESFNLIVLDLHHLPKISIEKQTTKPNKDVTFYCIVIGYPVSNVTFFYVQCPPDGRTRFPNEDTCGGRKELKEQITQTLVTKLIQNVSVTFTPTNPGRVICNARNTIGSDECSGLLVIQKYIEDLSWHIPRCPIAQGDSVQLSCYASMYVYADSLEIQRNGSKMIELIRNGVKVINIMDKIIDYMYIKMVTIKDIRKQDSGLYKCVAKSFDRKVDSVSVEIAVNDAIPTHFADDTELEQTIKLEKNSPLLLWCRPVGMPVPTVEWFKDNQKLSQNHNILINSSRIFVDHADISDSGQYECRATNRLSAASIRYDVIVSSTNGLGGLSLAMLLFFVLVLILLSIVALTMYRRERAKRLEQNLSCPQLNIEATGVMSTALTVSEQADLLPYDTKYDFGMDKLKLGARLGFGAFGDVLLAEATGIVNTEPTTLVAVKRVKDASSNADIRALIMEMKIMIHLGKHLNVVNLLGVVRENLDRRELFVITEYCECGNLCNFVRKNRSNFVNQINPLTQQIDPRIMNVQQSKVSELWPNTFKLISLGLNRNAANSQIYNTTLNNRTTFASARSTITTTDLVCWSFQVSQGMNYMARRGVLHGDLAARNLLLTKNGVVKICDFGLSRTMMPEEDYKKKSKTAMPLKWMAIESIERQTFNSSSDIWSFGVMMWELFSLGAVPYVSIRNEALLEQLLMGYRLECPKYCSRSIYANIMDCWKIVPSDRPRFFTLGERLAHFLPDELLEEFTDRSAKYVQFSIDADPQNNYFGKITLPNNDAPIQDKGAQFIGKTINVSDVVQLRKKP